MERLCITVKEDERTGVCGRIFGVSFEDISHAADGGLYGEMVRNRSFEFEGTDHEGYHSLTAWSLVQRGSSVARVHVETGQPLYSGNPHYAVMEVITAGEGGGICNQGYHTGLALKKGEKYRFSCFYRLLQGNAAIRVRLENEDGRLCYGEEKLWPEAGGWQQGKLTLACSGTDFCGRLVLLAENPVVIAFDMVSLFPADTFRGRENGLRRDLAELIESLHPSFVRFPGGTLVYSGSLEAQDRCSMYRWKNTIGSVWQRPVKRNPYFYCQSLGLGFYEYFQFCEDIGAEPVPVIAAGVDFGTLRAVPLEQMQEWIDDAVDLIEFANGGEDTHWGSIRTAMGHPEGFGLKYLAVGSDAEGQEFYDRYALICQAVRERYPEITLILSCGAGGDSSESLRGRAAADETGTQFIDEHLYVMPNWVLAHQDWFAQYEDKYDVMIGSFDGGRIINSRNRRKLALGEATLMLLMEQSPVVKMVSFTPLLRHEAYGNWRRSLIRFDNAQACGTEIYYIQKLFGQEVEGSLLETETDWEECLPGVADLGGGIALGTEYAQVEIERFLFHDEETDRDVMIADFVLSEKKKRQECLKTGSSHYSCSFRFRKRNDTLARNLVGDYYFYVDFAFHSRTEHLTWRLDRWHCYSNISGFSEGETCDLQSYLLRMEPGKYHEARLCVDGARVRAYVDGKLVHDVQCRMPVVQPLYYSLSKKDSGEITLKAVNWEKEKELVLKVPGWRGGSVVLQTLEESLLEEERDMEEVQGSCIREYRTAFLGENCCLKIPGNSAFVVKLGRRE